MCPLRRFRHNPLEGTSWRRWVLLFTLLLIPKLLTTGQEVPELGTVYRQNALQWDYPWATETNVVGFRIYVAPTNFVPYVFIRLGDLKSQRWPGTNSSSGLNGVYVVGVTAVARLVITNMVTMFAVTNDVESEMSQGLVTFKDGIPVPPGNVQLFTVLQLVATNNLPVPPYTGLVPLTLKGPEYDLSGR